MVYEIAHLFKTLTTTTQEMFTVMQTSVNVDPVGITKGQVARSCQTSDL